MGTSEGQGDDGLPNDDAPLRTDDRTGNTFMHDGNDGEPEGADPAAMTGAADDGGGYDTEYSGEHDDEYVDEYDDGRHKPFVRSLFEWGAWIAGAIVVALVLQAFVVQAFYIPSESMLPTLEKNDRVIVNKLWYKFRDVHRGDVVVFKAPIEVQENEGLKNLVKRVIGLPGETIEGRADGFVYINGVKLEEPWLPEDTRTEPFSPLVIPEGEYFMMGDYRSNSRDSRFFPRHFIPFDDIVGRAFIRIWPINRVDLL